MNLRTNQKGFTLVELLIVIVVIAILAAISIVAYSGIQNRAKTSAGQQLASQVEKKAQAYYTIENTYPFEQSDFAGVPEAQLEGNVGTFITTTAGLNSTTADGGKVIAYEPCGVTGTAPNQTATGAEISYWDYAATPSPDIETTVIGTGC